MADNRGRRSLRLPEYDYSQSGAYFVTACSFKRKCLFGQVISGEVHLSMIGTIVHDQWLRTESLRNEVVLDQFVVMPISRLNLRGSS